MAEEQCACQQFDRLQGAAVQAYLTKFLERQSETENSGGTFYRCRVCQTRWQKTGTEGEKRASLLRLAIDDPAA